MKTKYTAMMLAALFLSAACAKEEKTEKTIVSPDFDGTKIEVGLSALTRTALGEPGTNSVPVVWSTGDEIAVIQDKGTAQQKVAIFKLAGEGGSSTGSFEYLSGDAPTAAAIEVVYPASAVESGFTVPADQNYVAGSIDPAAMFLSGSRTKADETVVLSHGSAAFLLPLTGEEDQLVSSIEVSVGSSKYTLSCNEPVALSAAAVPFYIAVQPGTSAADYTFTVNATKGTPMTKVITWMAGAGKIGRIPPTEFEQFHRLAKGDYFGGGFIFAIAEDNSYVKVVSADQATLAWATGDAASVRVGTEAGPDEGAANTALIQAQDNFSTNYPAAAWCVAHGEGWYMPSRSEINVIVNGLGLSEATIDEVNANIEEYSGTPFASGKAYFTSCEQATSDANVWTVSIPKKGHNAYIKTTARPVRAVKKIMLSSGAKPDPKPSTVTEMLAIAKNAFFTAGNSTSYGPDLYLRYTDLNTSGTNNRRSFIQLDLTGINKAKMNSAILKLTVDKDRTVFTDQTEAIIKVYKLADCSWTEDSSDGSTKKKGPTLAATNVIYDALTLSNTDTILSIDVTDYVLTSLESGISDISIGMTLTNVNNTNTKVYFYPRSTSNESIRPYLEVNSMI